MTEHPLVVLRIQPIRGLRLWHLTPPCLQELGFIHERTQEKHRFEQEMTIKEFWMFGSSPEVKTKNCGCSHLLHQTRFISCSLLTIKRFRGCKPWLFPIGKPSTAAVDVQQLIPKGIQRVIVAASISHHTY